MNKPNLSIFNRPPPNWAALLKTQQNTTKEEARPSVPAKEPSLNNMKYRQRLRNRLEKGNRPTRYGVNWMTRRSNPRMSPLNPRFTRANNRRPPSVSGNLTNVNLYN